MKVCQACGYGCEDDAQFCSRCGEYFPKPGEGPAKAAPTPTMQTVPGMPQPQRPDDEFSRTVSAWAERLKSGTEVDDATYARILEECTESLFRAINAAGTHSRASVSELAILIDDRDLITDLLAGIADRAGRIGYQKELMNTANQYLFLAVDAFGVYTDLHDLKGVCDDAVAVFDGMAERVGSLEPVASRNDPEAFLRNYSSFFSIVGRKVGEVIDSNTPEELERMADHWAERSGKRFSDVILGAANMNVQLVGTGKLGSKLASRARDMQLDAFVKMYTNLR